MAPKGKSKIILQVCRWSGNLIVYYAAMLKVIWKNIAYVFQKYLTINPYSSRVYLLYLSSKNSTSVQPFPKDSIYTAGEMIRLMYHHIIKMFLYTSINYDYYYSYKAYSYNNNNNKS